MSLYKLRLLLMMPRMMHVRVSMSMMDGVMTVHVTGVMTVLIWGWHHWGKMEILLCEWRLLALDVTGKFDTLSTMKIFVIGRSRFTCL